MPRLPCCPQQCQHTATLPTPSCSLLHCHCRALLASGASTLSAIFRCPYGNFVAQHALQCTTHRLQRALLDAVLREAAALRKTRHGKHVAVKAHNISRALAAKQQQLAGAGLKQAAGFA